MPVTRKLRCRVEKVRAVGEGVYTVDLAPVEPVPRFKPGQFLHLTLDEYDPSSFWPESRIFSIASSPARRDFLQLAYSVRGVYTARMERELCEGRQVWVKLPYGEFVVEDKKDVVLFAGGTGITAFTAFIGNLDPEMRQRVCLAYGVRTRSLQIYRDEIEEKAASIPNLCVRYFMEDLVEGSAPEDDKTVPGRLNVDAVWPHVREPLSSIYYISGPPAMIAGITRDLLNHGINKDLIRIDAWD